MGIYGHLEPDSAYNLMKSQTSLGEISYEALKTVDGSNNAIAVDTDPRNNDKDDEEFHLNDSDLHEQYNWMAVNCEQQQQ